MLTAEQVTSGAEEVRRRIVAAGGDPLRVRILAVTKGFPAEVARVAAAAGLVDLGENYAQDLAAKAAALHDLQPAPRWHFIGRLQRNKVKVLAPHVALWQSIDRIELGAEVARRAPGAAVLAQVNPLEEPQKGGCAPDEVRGLVDAMRADGLEVRGLMAVGPTPGDGPDRTTEAFATVATLADELGLVERSMGMSEDLEAAVRAGSTMVRVGRGLFGERPAR